MNKKLKEKLWETIHMVATIIFVTITWITIFNILVDQGNIFGGVIYSIAFVFHFLYRSGGK